MSSEFDPITLKITDARYITFIKNEYYTPAIIAVNCKDLFYDEELAFPLLQQNKTTSGEDIPNDAININIPDSFLNHTVMM